MNDFNCGPSMYHCSPLIDPVTSETCSLGSCFGNTLTSLDIEKNNEATDSLPV